LVDKRPSHFPDTEFDKKIFQSFIEWCELAFFKVYWISVFLKSEKRNEGRGLKESIKLQ